MSVNDPAAFLEQLAAEVADLRDRVEAMGVASLEALLTPQSVEPRLGAASAPSATSGAGDVAPAAVIAQGAVVSDSIADGAIDFAKFAAGIVPPRLSATAPTLPSANYPVGSFYFNTTDKHLYKTTDGNTWGLAVDAGDIVSNTITAGQIAAGAIGADEVAANAITAGKLAVGGATGSVFVTNAGFETGDLTGWEEYDPDSNGDVGIEAVATAGAKLGAGLYQAYVKRNSTSGSTPQLLTYFLPVQPGENVLLSSLVSALYGAFYLHFYKADTTYISSSYREFDASAGGRWNHSAVAPALAAYFRIGLGNAYTTSAPTWAVYDEVRVAVGDASILGAAGNVVIDSSGVTISNGKLTFQDEYGQTALDGQGFGPTWDDFIANGIHNSMFQAGTVGTLSDGATIPWWTVSRSGTPVISLDTDTGMPGGRSVRFKPTATNQYGYLLSDLIPVQGGFEYSTSFLAEKISLGAGFYLNPYITIYWYKADGTTAASPSTSAGADRTFTTADAAAAMRVSTRVPAEAPLDARYAKVRLTFYAFGTFTGTPEIAVGAVRIEDAPAQVQTDTLPSVNLIPFVFQRADVPANTTANLQVSGATGGGSVVMPMDGWIVGISVRMSTARTAGDVGFDAVVSGTVSSIISTYIDALDTQQSIMTSGSDFVTNGEPFTAGDRLYVRFVSSSTWAPTTADVTVVLWVALQGWGG